MIVEYLKWEDLKNRIAEEKVYHLLDLLE